MFASDIHGDAVCCERLLERFGEEKAERLFLLGDILYHGPRNDLPAGYAPKEVIRMLNERREDLLCVRGNCDTEVDQMVLEFPVLSESALIYADGTEIFLSHGHHFNPDTLPPLKPGAVLINGHTHVPKDITVNGIRCLNCGSVALPKENSAHSYLIFENGEFAFKTLS